ncbi:hypothetical protein BD410DRAFT_804719 [Rickenella mellea]|uniref:F-box domain-containing protein n=1 Tax=Rickenella mellea TaxID=50990 RepID=A0A4Y7Q0J7_9AGAM|nr:hypothetical protein BD410DRAFT_804719 [Rickenella mellea]
MQRQCRRLAFQEGIKRLPDEILVYIFEFGHRSTNYNDFALTVSRVCRRFRGVALTTPRLWTRLHVDPNCPDDFSRLEERFKDHGVDIWMSNKEEYEGPRFDEFANILKRYIPGACHLRIDGGLDVIDALDGDKPVLRRLKSIVHYNKANTYEDMNHTKNGICPICLSSKASTSSGVNQDFENQWLMDSLLTMPCLRVLSLAFQSFNAAERACSPVVLPELREFNISIKYSTPLFFLIQILEALTLPKLSVLKITLDQISIDPWSPRQYVDMILAALLICKHFADTLHLRTSCSFTGLLHHIIRSVPCGRWPPLKTLCIKHSRVLSEPQVEMLVNKFRFDDNWDTLESFQLISCGGLSEEFLLVMQAETGGKLQWWNVAAGHDNDDN